VTLSPDETAGALRHLAAVETRGQRVYVDGTAGVGGGAPILGGCWFREV
jgi:hypothetical protein